MRSIVVLTVLLSSITLLASADFATAGADAERTGWVRSERVFNPQNVENMRLLWRVQLDSTAREMHNLFPPLVLSNVAMAGGPKEVAVVAGISDDLWGLDTSTGATIWHRHFDTTLVPSQLAAASTICPGGQTALPVAGPGPSAGSYTIYAVSWDGRLWRVNAGDGADVAPAEKFMPPNAKLWSLNLANGVLYTGISEGCGGVSYSFFSYDVATRTASGFVPGGGGLWGRRGPAVAPDGTVWMGTGDGYYDPSAGHLGDSIVAVKLDANKQLQPAGWFAPPNVNWLWRRDLDINVTPIVFDMAGRHLLFGTSKECRLWMVDRDVVGTPDKGPQHQQLLDRSDLICNPAARFDARGVWGSMAAWVQANRLYVAVPFLGPAADTFNVPTKIGHPERGGVVVFLVDTARWKLVPVWMYGDIDQGDEAVYANGVLFVNGAGEDTYQGQEERAWNEPPRVQASGRGSAGRIANSRRAVIDAFDAATGSLLWSSGNQISSFNHGSGMTAVNGKAYIGTFDGMLYCFGVAQ